jgi:acyl phosphate:glycerol-3-phosphate acyltransferase
MSISMSSLSILLAYLLGSIPFGAIVARFSGVDILKTGSGNIGATNVHRALGIQKGLMVLALDVVKGVLAVVIAQFASLGLSPVYPILAALAAVLGHSYSVFLGFRGGRSVAVALGAFLLLAPMAIGIALAVFIVTAAASRYISLASMLAAVAFVVVAGILSFSASPYNLPLFAACLITALLIVMRHRANLGRLLRGEENRFSFKKKG